MDPRPRAPWREEVRRIIFEADTPAGKAFDVGLILVILFSLVIVALESIHTVRDMYGPQLRMAEWIVTLLFSIEYALRLACVPKPGAYAGSFFGVVDLLAILPTYLSLFLPGSQSLAVVRALRLLRIFRILKLGPYLTGANTLLSAMRASRHKVGVFLGSILVLVVILGSAMYLIEGEANGFTSIPRGMYWAIVTLTTVGYGDISPHTIPGQLLASVVMMLGYAIIAIPTGIVTAEIVHATTRAHITTRTCTDCFSEGHEHIARFCKDCGAQLPPNGD